MAFDIERLKRRVIEKYPWFGGVAAGLVFEPSNKVSRTAGNGKTVFYNPDYLASLAPDGQIFALSHEICHVAFDHISRSREKDSTVWSKATDAVINQLLKADGLGIPEGYVDEPEAMGMGAEQYYDILIDYKLAIELVDGSINKPEGPEGGSGGGGGDSSGDDHSLWDEANSQEDKEEQEREEELLKELDRVREIVEEMGEEDLPQRDGGRDPQGDGDSDEDDEDDELGLFSRTESLPGNTIDPGRRYVDELRPIEPVIDWRMVLRETVKFGVDWTYTFATLEDGLVRPSLGELPMPETEVVIDTSWSVDETLLKNFLMECVNILAYSKLKIGCFDTQFYGFQDVRIPQDIKNIVLDGGGGTDFNAAVGAFTLRVENKIIFTDGEADIPQEPIDAIWLIYGEKKIDPPGGRVIHITPEQLKKLRGEQA